MIVGEWADSAKDTAYDWKESAKNKAGEIKDTAADKAGEWSDNFEHVTDRSIALLLW